jgi:hypothetical protein
MAFGWVAGMGAANDRYAAVASDGLTCSPPAEQARPLPLVVIAIALSVILAACSHAPSSNYSAAPQPQPQTQRFATSPDPAVAVAQPVPPPQPDENEQALASAYPSESLGDLVRGLHNPPPVQASAPPPQAVSMSATMPIAPAQAAVSSGQAAGPPIALQAPRSVASGASAGYYSAAPPYPPAAPGSTNPAQGMTSPYGAAGTANVPAAAPAPPPPDYDEALTAAYPSQSLGDVIFGRGGSH